MPLPDRILYVDLETTGTDEKLHGIIQIAAIYEVNGKEVERFSSFVCPDISDIVDPEALAHNGHTAEEIKAFPAPVPVAHAFVQFLSKYIAPYDKADKVWFCGHNSEFDFKFLHRFMKRFAPKSLGNFCYGYKLDSYALATYLKATGKLPPMENLKLGTLTGYYQIKHASHHDAMSDIEAARDLFKKLHSIISGEELNS